MPITVAIVEDDARIRRSLATMLGTAEDIECVGQFANAEDALRKIPALQPRVIFMDIHLPGMSGVDFVRELAAVEPKPQIVMLTSYDDSEAIFSSLSAGACGYLLKPIRTAQLLAAVRDVYSGGAPMSGQIARRVVETFNKPAAPSASPTTDTLSTREREILQLLSEGYLYKEIADRLGISYSTVRTHIERIYEKLHVCSRAQAVAKAGPGFLAKKPK
ncbi:MAG: DNA-binding response regulator [Pedosphaera sp.]|nr:MAG: DNA-binding response regulator [Pedosphaera sp.]